MNAFTKSLQLTTMILDRLESLGPFLQPEPRIYSYTADRYVKRKERNLLAVSYLPGACATAVGHTGDFPLRIYQLCGHGAVSEPALLHYELHTKLWGQAEKENQPALR